MLCWGDSIFYLFLQRIEYLFHYIVNLIRLKLQTVSQEIAQMSVSLFLSLDEIFSVMYISSVGWRFDRVYTQRVGLSVSGSLFPHSLPIL